MIGGYSEQDANEIKRQVQERMGQQIPGVVPPLPGYGVPTPNITPINQRIRELTADVADAADFLTDRRRESQEASAQLAEAEARFANLSERLSKTLEECRAMGGLASLRVGR